VIWLEREKKKNYAANAESASDDTIAILKIHLVTVLCCAFLLICVLLIGFMVFADTLCYQKEFLLLRPLNFQPKIPSPFPKVFSIELLTKFRVFFVELIH
jgi:hypothetical protein